MTVTFFEHGFGHPPEECSWTDNDLVLLERLRQQIGSDVLRPTVRAGKRVLQAAQHVGVVRLRNRTIQILPKIYHSSDKEPNKLAHEATANLLHMLSYAERLPIREVSITPLCERKSDWFEVLTHLFSCHLMEEWRKGAVRQYQNKEDDLPVLKGKWRIADQLRRPERRHIFAVAYEEFTADNPLNRLFRYVVERLWKLTRDSENRQRLGTLRQWMDEESVELRPELTPSEACPAPLTRLHRQYEPLLNLARLFLEDSGLQLTAGGLNSYAFVFDMNRLFESFLVGFILRHRESILPADLLDCELLPQSQGVARYLATKNGSPLFRLKPDLAFRKNGTFPLLLDAKYKRLNPQDARYGVSQDDLYQMHAYAQRYDCPRVLLVYPKTVDMDRFEGGCFMLEGGKRVEVRVVDMGLDLRNWKCFADKLKLIFNTEKIYGKPN